MLLRPVVGPLSEHSRLFFSVAFSLRLAGTQPTSTPPHSTNKRAHSAASHRHHAAAGATDASDI